jgi:hypothetical protein
LPILSLITLFICDAGSIKIDKPSSEPNLDVTAKHSADKQIVGTITNHENLKIQ